MTSFAEIGKDIARWIGAKSAGSADRSPRRPWGEDLIGQSLGSRLYGATWSDVDPDELVCLVPSLAARHDDERVTVLRALLLQALERELHGRDGDIAAGEPAIEGMAGLVSASTLEALARRPLPSRRRDTRASAEYRRPAADAPDHWRRIARFSVIACLDTALRAVPVPRTSPSAEAALTTADALVVSLVTGINAGYLDPTHAIAHEQLEAGAWIGQLLAGRPAWLPAGLAARLIDELARGTAGPAGAGVCSRLMQESAAASVGLGRLLALARRVARTGSAELVRPPFGFAERRLIWPPWNAELHAAVAAGIDPAAAVSSERGADAADR